jgi:hypothetical protein
MDRKTQQELHDLLSALLDGALSAEGQDRLGDLLRQHPQARDLYLAYFNLHANLALGAEATDLSRLLPLTAAEPPSREVAPGPAAAPPGAMPLLRPRRPRRVVRVALGLSALAAGVLLAVFLWPRPSAVPPTAEEEPQDRTVAVLLQALGAEWEPGEPARRPGTPLSPGRLRLKSGLVHIEFYSGALVILQGPADFELISSTEAYCTRGKLWATVPPLAQGFTVGSPKYDLVDRGTEFGLDVAEGGQTEVHVFHGKVDLYKPGTDRAATAPQALKTGQGVRLEKADEARSIKSNPAAFPSAQRLAERLQAERERRQQEWLEASKELRRDPGLLVYYPFQDEEPWSRTLLDRAEVRQGQGAHDGTIVGCTWATGRWPGKKGLEFKQVSDRVRLHVPGEFEALTLMAWVRVDALPNRFNSLFMTDSWDDFEPHWHISNDGKLELGVQGPERKRGVHYYTPVVFTPDRLGQWTHLAVVYDRAGGQVVHYVNGKVVAPPEGLQLDVALCIGNAEIGNWNVTTRRHNHPVRYFTGCVDEFLLFARALSEAEVEKLYTKGRPPS